MSAAHTQEFLFGKGLTSRLSKRLQFMPSSAHDEFGVSIKAFTKLQFQIKRGEKNGWAVPS